MFLHCFWHLAVNLSALFCKQVLLLKHRSGVRGLQKSMTDVPLEHHEECACVCKDDSDWPQTCVIAANGSIRDVRNEPLPLFLSPPLPLEANKILLLSCCPFTNWMKQNRLESNKSSKWIWLLWNTNRVLWVHFRKAQKNHWSRSGPLPLGSEDYFLPFFWDKNTEAFVPFLPEVFFKVQSVWADTVMKNGSFFVQVLFYVYKWAGSSCLAPSAPLLLPSRQRKVVFRSCFLLLPSCFTTEFVCGTVQPQYSWNVSLMRLHYV